MKIRKNIHNCGKGFSGIVRMVKRPGIGLVKFCEFCGKEFHR